MLCLKDALPSYPPPCIVAVGWALMARRVAAAAATVLRGTPVLLRLLPLLTHPLLLLPLLAVARGLLGVPLRLLLLHPVLLLALINFLALGVVGVLVEVSVIVIPLLVLRHCSWC